MQSFSFPKSERLLKRPDFVNVNRSGRRYHTRHFTVIIRKNRLGITRLGVTVTKRTGNAVRRNRIKRLVREFFRLNKAHFPQGYDIVIAAKKDASDLDLRKTEEELAEVMFRKKFCV
ncbi:MAG: ribonuclease P protein component [Deltaproteobacteria bacterium]|nr:MAG: ribonuclease P protein component [Deltaproteobacteria bacterium]